MRERRQKGREEKRRDTPPSNYIITTSSRILHKHTHILVHSMAGVSSSCCFDRSLALTLLSTCDGTCFGGSNLICGSHSPGGSTVTYITITTSTHHTYTTIITSTHHAMQNSLGYPKSSPPLAPPLHPLPNQTDLV